MVFLFIFYNEYDALVQLKTFEISSCVISNSSFKFSIFSVFNIIAQEIYLILAFPFWYFAIYSDKDMI